MTLPANINCANAFSNEGLRERSGRICLVLFCSITIAAPDSCFCTMFCECSMLAFKLSKCHIFSFHNFLFTLCWFVENLEHGTYVFLRLPVSYTNTTWTNLLQMSCKWEAQDPFENHITRINM